MSTRSLIWGSLAFVVMVSGVAAQAATAGAAEQALTAAEHQWLKSQGTNNVELLAPLLADKVVGSVRRERSLKTPHIARIRPTRGF
jgi:hypothetical protein